MLRSSIKTKIALVLLAFSPLTAWAQAPTADLSAAAKKAWKDAELGRKKAQKKFDDEIDRVIEEAEKSLEQERKKLTKEDKLTEALAVQASLEELKERLKKGESLDGGPNVVANPINQGIGKRPAKPKWKSPPMVGAVKSPRTKHWYMPIKEEMTWKQAKKWCEDNKGYLVIIEDAQEQKDLVEWLNKPGLDASYWIGATDEALEGQWLWVDGTPVTFTQWAKNQPDNNGDNKDSHFVRLSVGATGEWDDARILDKAPFICEWDE